MATRKEVAKRAGVSEATVSRVFSHATIVNPKTKAKVLEVAEALGYHPSALAQSFARKKSMNIGIVLPYIPKVKIFTHDYFSQILSGASEAARVAGYDVVLFYRDVQQREVDYRKYYYNKKVDGCILLGTLMNERKHLRQVREEGFPFVLISHSLHEKDPYAVDADHIQGSYKAIQHLVDYGHRHIAFLNGPELYANSLERLHGVQRAYQDFSLKQKAWFTGNFSRTSGYRFADEFLDLSPQPTALFAANDRMAIGFMQRLREKEVQPGKEVAVVGYDDSELGEYMDPTLTSVSVPFYDMGKKAVQKLIQHMNTESSDILVPDIPLPTSLKVRLSSTQYE